MKRLLKRKRNRALALIVLVNAILLFLIYSNLLTYPNTFLGLTDISGKTAGQIETIVREKETIHPKIQVKNRTYEYSYDQLGIVVDPKKAIDAAFAPNRRLAFVPSLFSKHSIPAPLAFTQKFDEFIGDMVFDFSLLPDQVSLDPVTKSIRIEENDQSYRFGRESLQDLLTTRFGEYQTPIYPLLSKVTNETIDQIANTNQRLAFVFGEPMYVYLDLGGTTRAVELKGEDIREATRVTLEPDSIHVRVDVDGQALNTVLTRRVRQSGFPIRNAIVTPAIEDDFQRAITLRFGGTNVGAVATKLDDGPNTNGSIAAKYIEIDISQQKLYLFENGKVKKSYTVSTGYDYPTPTGTFTVLNKVGLGFSTIYNVWLPWWMGFAFDQKLNAYFGIHEQPYVLTDDGKPVIADPRPIGTPSTGGCVALAPGAAREVYWFATIGTPIHIYN